MWLAPAATANIQAQVPIQSSSMMAKAT